MLQDMDKFITDQVSFWLRETMRSYFGDEVDTLNWSNSGTFLHEFNRYGFEFIEDNQKLYWEIKKDNKTIATFKPALNFNKEN